MVTLYAIVSLLIGAGAAQIVHGNDDLEPAAVGLFMAAAWPIVIIIALLIALLIAFGALMELFTGVE